MPRKLKGIRPWKGKWQAYVQVDGRTYAKSYPLTTAIETMRAWRESQRRTHAARAAPDAGSFAADVADYLSRITALPTYHQKAAHLELWLDALGRDRPRHSITAADIDRIMQGWLTTPTMPDYASGQRGRPSDPHGLAPGTVRKRRTTLRSLFSLLDGKHAANLVRASQSPQDAKPELRGTDYATIARILAAMPESPTKRRVTVLAYTGLPPQLLKSVTRADLRLADGAIRVRPRRKGRGVEARTLPLTPDGLAAVRAFDQAHAFGWFDTEKANISFQRACRRVDVHGLTLYDLRHSFGAQLYRVTRDLATVARFLLLASTKMAERYAHAANQDVDAAAAAAFLPPVAAPVSPRKKGKSLSRKPVPRRKAS